MSNFRYFMGVILSASLMAGGCKKDKNQDYSTLQNKNSQLNEFVPSLISTLDNDQTLEFPFTLSETPITDMHITVKAISGNATEGVDYEIATPQVVIPAFRKDGVIKINIIGDDVIEGPESFVIQIGDEFDPNVKVFKTVTVNLTDYVSSDLNIFFDWDKIVDVPDFGEIPVGINFDIDFYLLDADGFDTGNYTAATGDSPEHMVLSTEDTGTYYIYSSLYVNVFRAVGVELYDKVPITMDFNRPGALASFKKVQADSLAYDLFSPDFDNDGDESIYEMAKVVITETGFMVYDIDGTSIVNTRKAKPTLYPTMVPKNKQSKKQLTQK